MYYSEMYKAKFGNKVAFAGSNNLHIHFTHLILGSSASGNVRARH